MGPFTRSSQSERKDKCLASQGNKCKTGTTARQLVNKFALPVCSCASGTLCPVPSMIGLLHSCLAILWEEAHSTLPVENLLNFWQQQWNHILRVEWCPLGHSLQHVPAEIALLISGHKYNLNICLKGVKETLPGLAYRQCSLMDLGVDDLQQGMWASVSSKWSCISLWSTLRFTGSYSFV